MQPRQRRIQANGIALSVYEWGQQYAGTQPTIVFTHATGFHGRCWDQVIRCFDGYHIIALDQRGHGQSDRQTFDSWLDFANDLKSLMDVLGIRDALGVGHSMGGHVSLMAAALNPALFSRLLVFDPVILAPEYYDLWDPQVLQAGARHHSARRRNRFASVAEALERYRERPPYSQFAPEVLRDYFEYGLEDDGDEVVLACAPEFEARIYDTVFSNVQIAKALEDIRIPVIVVRGMEAPNHEATMSDFRYSPTWQALAGNLPGGRDILLAEMDHFMPMTHPEEFAELIRAELINLSTD